MCYVPLGLFLLLASAESFWVQPAKSQSIINGPVSPLDQTSFWKRTSPSIDPTKLPLGDRKFSDSPKIGQIYTCDPTHYFSLPLGSHVRGPWIHGETWDITQKPSVRGEVAWPEAYFSISIDGEKRLLVGNGLPVGNPSGLFPTQPDDPAFRFDGNPDPLKPYNVNVAIPVSPLIAAKPFCMRPLIGYALDGVVFQFALSSMMGHDEIAYEMQDACGGMPETSGIYHRHAGSPCIPHINETNALIGYALDGFGIFSPFDSDGKELTTNDLDECHGLTSPIMWDGKLIQMYHYVVTRDYPYTIGCFRGTPSYVALPPPPLTAIIMSFFVIAWQKVSSGFGR